MKQNENSLGGSLPQVASYSTIVQYGNLPFGPRHTVCRGIPTVLYSSYYQVPGSGCLRVLSALVLQHSPELIGNAAS